MTKPDGSGQRGGSQDSDPALAVITAVPRAASTAGPCTGAVTIRPATVADLPAIQAIFELSLAEAGWLPAAAKQNPVFAKVSEGETLHVAEIEPGVVAGFVSVQPADPFIHHLYVHPSARGRSVGQALLDSLQAWLPQPWRLKCVRQNVGALKFYVRNGWEEVGSGQSEHGNFLILSFHSKARGKSGPNPASPQTAPEPYGQPAPNSSSTQAG